MAVWRIWSLHLSWTEARYRVGRMAYNVVCQPVYGMLRNLASPKPRAFTACCSVYPSIHGGATTGRIPPSVYTSDEHMSHRMSCSSVTGTYIG